MNGYLFSENAIPEPLLDLLLPHLEKMETDNQFAIHWVDSGLATLLAREDPDKGIRFLETFLMINHDFSIKTFDSVVEILYQKRPGLLNHLMTRWFLQNNHLLHNAIQDLVPGRTHLSLEADLEVLDISDGTSTIFLAKKAIGYLFSAPKTAANILISLIASCRDHALVQELTRLLYNPMLINYPGEVGDYLEERLSHENSQIAAACEEATKFYAKYLEELKLADHLPELHPSQAQREAYRRNSSRELAEGMKKAEEKSIFRSLVKRQLMLYGTSSIHYSYSPEGEVISRQETPLQRISTSVEFPRMTHIDPLGLDYELYHLPQKPNAKGTGIS